MDRYNPLQLREVFHIEFLRRFGRMVKAENYALKGGVNLRLFFKSFRYSEDMDLDARAISRFQLKDLVMNILENSAFQDNLKPFGIARVVSPDIARAKQTETTQRFKIHLISSSGEDLFTKIEFSRRGFTGNVVIGAVDDSVLRAYKIAPLLTPHYDNYSAIAQKLRALAGRKALQARDVFDLYVLSSQYAAGGKPAMGIDSDTFSKAHERVFEAGFERFNDTVVSYLSAGDQAVYGKPGSWEEVQLKTARFIEELRKSCA
jgi:predicted nucleotidyltransferase component of viral defense system